MNSRPLDEIARRHGILLILEFGSAVSGRLHPKSDLDVAVLLDRPGLSYAEYGHLIHDLQTLAPGREVDLAVLNRADPLFLKQVTERCRLLFSSPRRLHELKLYAFKRHQDHRRYLALERAYVTRTLRGPVAP